ncbi:TRAP transporter substrate-binding protein [Rhodobacteraceae bacterium F11138]|nr:TRAP transporter substrate-binding protein [Rhodobacteraceae bacterium F11138]
MKHILAILTFIALMLPAHAADVTLRVHTLVKSPHPYNDMASFMKSELEEKSDGRIAVKIFDAGQLGQDPAVLSEMALGTIDVMISTTSNAAQEIPEFAIFNMPYLFGSIDEMADTVAPGSAVHQHFETVYQDRGVGMKLLALGGSGTRNLATADVTVTSLDDLKGLKMRTPPSPMVARTWAALDMLPVTVAWGELYAAMQTGVAEAMESSLAGYTGSKLYEVAPNLALTGHTVQANHISVSDVTWKKLPDDLKMLLQETAEAANRHGVEKAKEYDGALVDQLAQEHGVNVSRPDTSLFIAKLKPSQIALAEEMDLAEEYALITGN